MPPRLARPAVLAAAVLAYAAALVVLPSGVVPALAGTSPGATPATADAAYYRSSVVAVEPAAPGLTVTVADGGAVTLENRTGAEVVVLGYAREPYLRFTDGGMVLRNSAALTTALVAGRTPGPTAAAGGTSPRVTWEHVSHEPRFSWADVRTRWSSAQRPPIVQQDEHAAHRVLDWALQLTVGGRPTLVRGVVDWTGTPAPPQDADLVPWAVVGTALVVTLAGLGTALRRRRAATRAGTAPPEPELVRSLHATPPTPRRSPYDSGGLPTDLHAAPTTHASAPHPGIPAGPEPRRARRRR